MSLFNTTFKDRFISHIKPYKYKDKDNKIVGRYVVHFFNIQFTPVVGTHIDNAVCALIDISNKYKVPVYVSFHGVHVEVTYPTKLNNETVKNIVDTYMTTYDNMIKSTNMYVKA